MRPAPPTPSQVLLSSRASTPLAWVARVFRRWVRDTQPSPPRAAVLHIDKTLRVVRANAEAERLTGMRESQLRTQAIGTLIHSFTDQSPQIVEAVLACVRGRRTLRFPEPIGWHAPDGRNTLLRLSATALGDVDTGAMLTFEALLETTDTASLLPHAATHDLATGLPNRALLLDRLEQALANAQRRDTLIALLAIDLPPQRHTHPDIEGSANQDSTRATLRAAAESLQASIRRGDTLARCDANGFMILLDNLLDRSAIVTVAHKLLDQLDREFGADESQSSSIGISVGPSDSDEAATLLSMADKALYRGRLEGHSRFTFHSPALDAWSRTRQDLETALRHALDKGEFELFYQPQIDILSGRLMGLESLIRWHRPGRGLVKPATFIAVAEESGLISHIGDWAITDAMSQLARWRREGLPIVPLAVNVSARQCTNMHIVDTLRRSLNKSGLDPALLKVELTESTAMRDAERNAQLLQRIHDLGVRVAVDDFGTGCSSLSLLRRFPVSELKIDQRFMSDLDQNCDDAAFVRSSIALGHGLGMTVVAEGVETQAQLRFLADHGCNVAQGYLFAQALPAKEIRRWLTAPPPHTQQTVNTLI